MKKYNSVWVLWDKQENAIGRVNTGHRVFGVYVRKSDLINAARMDLTAYPARYEIHEVNLNFVPPTAGVMKSNESVTSTGAQEETIWRKRIKA